MLISGGVFGCLFLFISLRHLSPHSILFYQGIAACLIVPILQVIAARRWKKTPWHTSIRDGMTTFLVAYSFVITVPTNVERSFSVRMIEHLAQSPEGLDRAELTRFYTDDFVGQGGLDKRLFEQQVTGNLVERNSLYVLTPRGRFCDWLFRRTCDVFVCQLSAR